MSDWVIPSGYRPATPLSVSPVSHSSNTSTASSSTLPASSTRTADGTPLANDVTCDDPRREGTSEGWPPTPANVPETPDRDLGSRSVFDAFRNRLFLCFVTFCFSLWYTGTWLHFIFGFFMTLWAIIIGNFWLQFYLGNVRAMPLRITFAVVETTALITLAIELAPFAVAVAVAGWLFRGAVRGVVRNELARLGGDGDV